MTIEAHDEDEAIRRFLAANRSELVAFAKPRGRESIATVRRNDCLFLVRVYEN
jgi:hypothetical protein